MNTELLFGKFPELQTTRLTLKAIKPEDSESLLSVINDPEVVRRINDGMTYNLLDMYETITKSYSGLFRERKGIIWGMFLKANNQLIGLRMCFVDSINQPVMIQGHILSAYRRKGLTLEAYIEIIRFLKKANVQEIITSCEKNNLPAIGLLTKLGFEKESNIFNFHSIFETTYTFHKSLVIENTELFGNKIDHEPSNFKDALKIALEKYAERELAAADKYISLAIRMEPNNPIAYYHKGEITYYLHGKVASLEYLAKAIELDVNYTAAYRLRGICFYNLSNMWAAKEDLMKAASLGDNVAQDLLNKYF